MRSLRVTAPASSLPPLTSTPDLTFSMFQRLIATASKDSEGGVWHKASGPPTPIFASATIIALRLHILSFDVTPASDVKQCVAHVSIHKADYPSINDHYRKSPVRPSRHRVLLLIAPFDPAVAVSLDRKSTRLNSSH